MTSRVSVAVWASIAVIQRGNVRMPFRVSVTIDTAGRTLIARSFLRGAIDFGV